MQDSGATHHGVRYFKGMDRSLPSTAKPARPPTARSMLRTATHEAAHAVVALDERMTFEAVVLERTERSSGMLVNLRVRAIEDDDHVRVSLAGIIAHRLAVGRWHRQQFSRSHDDLA